jgi:hypothetical protein
MIKYQPNPDAEPVKEQVTTAPLEAISKALSTGSGKVSKKGTQVVSVGGENYTVPRKLARAITNLMTEYETNIKLANEIETNRIGILAAAKMLLKKTQGSDSFDEALAFLKTKVNEAESKDA